MNEKLKKYFALSSKAISGETLTDEEKAFMSTFNAQQTIDSLQADARRKAEKAAEDAKAESEKIKKRVEELENASKGKLSETENLQAQIKDLHDLIQKQQKEADELKKANALSARKSKVREIAEKNGIAFIEGVDKSLLMTGFENALASLDAEGLSNEELVNPIVEAYRATNKAVLRAEDTPGSGVPPTQRGGAPVDNPFSEEHWNLTKQIEIEQSNPALAKALEASAGKKKA